MARLARGEYLDPQTIQITHVVSRCVRRAFLCGTDPVSGNCFEHRRQWIQKRLEFLASVFAVDCLTYAVMSNHFHLILRNRPDIVRGWSDREIALRWLRLCPPRRNGKPTNPTKPTDSDVAMIVNDARRVAELRVRLSDVSWWVRMTTEKIARQANREDECTGRFWEGRFKAQLLLDEAAVLACAMYVDLNPIRAALAESLETSDFTGARARIDDLKDSKAEFDSTRVKRTKLRPSQKSDRSAKTKSTKRSYHWERGRRRKRCGWLSPIEIKEGSDPIGSDVDEGHRRASLKGFLPMSLLHYLELLDFTGRQVQSGKKGSIPASVQPLLQQLGIEVDSWFRLIEGFGGLFNRAVGNSVSLSAEAGRRGQNWMHASGASCFID